jgi:hypothetical protein
MILAQKPLLVVVAKLVTKPSPSEEGILRLYAYYKRSQRRTATSTMADQLALVIKSELDLLVRSDHSIRHLAVAIYHRMGTAQYCEDYFVDLAVWITTAKTQRALMPQPDRSPHVRSSRMDV